MACFRPIHILASPSISFATLRLCAPLNKVERIQLSLHTQSLAPSQVTLVCGRRARYRKFSWATQGEQGSNPLVDCHRLVDQVGMVPGFLRYQMYKIIGEQHAIDPVRLFHLLKNKSSQDDRHSLKRYCPANKLCVKLVAGPNLSELNGAAEFSFNQSFSSFASGVSLSGCASADSNSALILARFVPQLSASFPPDGTISC